MKKQEFLKELKASLKKFNDNETRDIINYYDEMISDKIEQGNNEEQIIDNLGSIKSISAQIQTDLINERLVKSKNIKKTSTSFWIILMLCASPALIPLGIAFFAVFVSVFAVIISFVIAFAGSGIGMLIAVIPIGIYAYADLGIAGVMLSTGILLLLAGLFFIIALFSAKVGTVMLSSIVKTTSKIINKSSKKGEK